jgi:hypothetical protein
MIGTTGSTGGQFLDKLGPERRSSSPSTNASQSSCLSLLHYSCHDATPWSTCEYPSEVSKLADPPIVQMPRLLFVVSTRNHDILRRVA